VAGAAAARISFASSRPSELLFPMDEFRRSCSEVIMDDAASSILQLGSPIGYAPLREYLFEEARANGLISTGDDLAITSGCQQAIDLIQRTLTSAGDVVLLEDPVYPGLRDAFLTAGARVIGIGMGLNGLDAGEFARAVRDYRPRLAVVTSNFQNPTGATLPRQCREDIVRIASDAGVVVVENDIYGALRYEGAAEPSLKQVAGGGDVITLGSFSKIAFPGLRVGWVIGPRPFIRRLVEAKQLCDLHSDQLSQAVLLRFAESGRLAAHVARVRAAGRERLQAVLSACGRHLPPGSKHTRPEGGMNLWVELADGFDAGAALSRAEEAGVSYLPGRVFSVSRDCTAALRLSFASLAPDEIETGLSILGAVFSREEQRARATANREPAPALV
jgi:2-aminoadipate transaminase